MKKQIYIDKLKAEGIPKHIAAQIAMLKEAAWLSGLHGDHHKAEKLNFVAEYMRRTHQRPKWQVWLMNHRRWFTVAAAILTPLWLAWLTTEGTFTNLPAGAFVILAAITVTVAMIEPLTWATLIAITIYTLIFAGCWIFLPYAAACALALKILGVFVAILVLLVIVLANQVEF